MIFRLVSTAIIQVSEQRQTWSTINKQPNIYGSQILSYLSPLSLSHKRNNRRTVRECHYNNISYLSSFIPNQMYLVYMEAFLCQNIVQNNIIFSFLAIFIVHHFSFRKFFADFWMETAKSVNICLLRCNRRTSRHIINDEMCKMC